MKSKLLLMKHFRFKKSWLIALLLTFVFNKLSFAQQPAVPLVNPVSPSAAALFKVLERPIGSYTGTVPLNFPIIEIKSGELTSLISLAYNSTAGIRVEELASNVGLGFSLNVGGRITRIQNGRISDDKPVDGYLNNSVKPSTFSSSNLSHLASLHAKQLDLEPDIFMYVFNGQSGKFYFNESGQAIMMQQSEVKVQYTTDANGISSWTLTDGKGQKYLFTLKETTTHTYTNISGNPNPPSNSYVSSWLLTETKDMNDENSITYTYNTGSTSFNSYSGGFKKNQAQWDNYCDAFTQDELMVNTQISEYVLTKITGSSGYVNLYSTTDRIDITGGSKLRSMSLYDYNNNLKKTFKFNYDYFNASMPLGNLDDKRLKLKNFSEFGASGTDSITFRFEYQESFNLPNRLSRAVDFWGFYNGQHSNTTYFPNTSSEYYGILTRTTNLANRHVDPIFTTANVLKKITYPTDGTRELVYEGNQALLKVNDQLRMDPDYTVNRSFYRSDFTYPATYLPTLSHPFFVNSTDGWTTFKYSLDAACGTGFRVEIYRLAYNGDPGGTLTHTFSNQPTGSWDLTNGYYRLEVYRTSTCTFYSIATTWNEYLLVDNYINTIYGYVSKNNREVGGLRIRQLKDFDPISTKINTTTYVYKLYSADSTLTSGFLNTDVRLLNEFNNNCYGSCQYMMLYSLSSYPLANDGGTYVVYPEVRTIESGAGWIDRRYTYQPDDLPPVTTYPIMPLSTEAPRLRGLLLAERAYNIHGTILKENTFTYGHLKWDSPGTLAWKVRLYYSRGGVNQCFESGDSPSSNPNSAKAIPYYQKGSVFGLWSSTETTFGSAGNNSITHSFTYDTASFGRPFIKQIKTTINANTTKELNYRYAFNALADFTFGLTGSEQTMKTLLLGRNYLQPIEMTNTVTVSNGTPTLLDGIKYTFGSFNSNDYHLLGIKKYTSLTSFKQTEFMNYDIKGNLLQKRDPSGVYEVYLWGYNGLYPVSKIRGGNYTIISAWLGSLNLNNPTSDAGLRNDVNVIRTNYGGSHAQVETFTYSPLTGLTSTTDAKGQTKYYEYDAFHRLKNTKDKDGNVTKSYVYHLKQ